MGTPQFGILTNPYPNRFGDPRTNMGIAFFLFFFSHAQDRRLLTKQTTTQQTLQLSPFLMRGMRRGAPRSSRRALTPRRVGAHPARVGVHLRLDAPRRGGNGGGVGSDAVTGGAGADWATCLSLLERAAATAADVARDGAASTAASPTRVGGCLFVYNTKINHHVCLKFFKLLSSPGIRATHDARPSNQLPPAATVASI